MPRTRQQQPIEYRDRKNRVWSVSEVAVLKVVSPAIDGPNLALVIRFEHMGDERFARLARGYRLARAGGAASVIRERRCATRGHWGWAGAA